MVDVIIHTIFSIAGPEIAQVSSLKLSAVSWNAIEEGKRDLATEMLDDGTQEVERIPRPSPPWSPYPSRTNRPPAS
jgi:hypothetical protein